jgi:antitoxin HigA-1
MAIKRKNKFDDPDISIGLPGEQEWSQEKVADIKIILNKRIAARTPAQKLEIELLSIQYRMEEYLKDVKSYQSLEYFVKDYLNVLNLTFKAFAKSIDTTDGNLKKYLTGERKFNTELAMRFASFFHTSPDLWLKVDFKNELIALHQKSYDKKEYKKYDYRKIVSIPGS